MKFSFWGWAICFLTLLFSSCFTLKDKIKLRNRQMRAFTARYGGNIHLESEKNIYADSILASLSQRNLKLQLKKAEEMIAFTPDSFTMSSTGKMLDPFYFNINKQHYITARAGKTGGMVFVNRESAELSKYSLNSQHRRSND